MKTGHLGFENYPNGLIYHSLYTIPQSFGVLLVIFVLIGIYCLTKIEKKFYFLIFPLFYFLMMGSWKVLFQRYAIPIFPFIAIFGAIGINYAIQKILKTNIYIYILG
jgi:hypothetical protein